MLGDFTVSFPNPLGDGAGADLRLYELTSSANETFNLFVSSDNVAFTLIGGFNATNDLIDFGGLFGGPVNFVRIVNTSNAVSADFDALEGLNLFVAVPAPAVLGLFGLGFGLLAAARQRR